MEWHKVLSELGRSGWAHWRGGLWEQTLPRCGSRLVTDSPASGPHENTSSVWHPSSEFWGVSVCDSGSLAELGGTISCLQIATETRSGHVNWTETSPRQSCWKWLPGRLGPHASVKDQPETQGHSFLSTPSAGCTWIFCWACVGMLQSELNILKQVLFCLIHASLFNKIHCLEPLLRVIFDDALSLICNSSITSFMCLLRICLSPFTLVLWSLSPHTSFLPWSAHHSFSSSFPCWWYYFPLFTGSSAHFWVWCPRPFFLYFPVSSQRKSIFSPELCLGCALTFVFTSVSLSCKILPGAVCLLSGSSFRAKVIHVWGA